MRKSLRHSLFSMAAVLFLVGPVGIGCPVGDLDENCKVNFADIRVFARQWLEDGACSEPNCANLDGLGRVSMGDFALLASAWLEDQTGLVISEFMAVNNDTLADEEGRFRDWIEIYNPMDTAVDLEGWYLTDNDSNLVKWQFPADVEIHSGEFLVVFASGNDRRDPNNPLHTNFKLDGGGGEGDVVLVAPDGATIAHEHLDYPKQLGDISYGLMQYARTLAAGGDTVSYHVPTGSDAGADWTAVDFNDSTWETGPTGLNFGFGGQQRVSYNDCVFEGGQHKAEHVTEYGIGNGFGGDTSGPLLDQATGEPTGVTAIFDQSGGVNWQPDPRNGGSDCAAGTDAYNTFGNFADMTGVIYYGSTGWWIDLIFTGLDPSTEYTFATSAARNNYTGRLTRYTIAGADTYTNASSTTPSPGVIEIPGSAGSSVRFNTGDNHNEGYVARWTGIRASDGTFKVRAEADPDNPSGRRAYSFDVFMLKGGFGGTNVQDQMKGVNASLWSRAEFYLEQGEREIFEKLTLRMKYEDGFVAYLNGQKVAWRNDPNSLQWNSTAPTNRPIEEAAAFESINLTAYMDLLQDGRNVLAIHALNDGKDDNEFLVLPELVAASGTGVPQYFTTPTPRTFNVAGTKGLVSEVWFSHKRGFYESPFDLTLSTEMSGAEIRYTTDGSRPTATNGSTYTPGSPIRIYKTTPLRAVALRPGYLDSKVETYTYIFLSDVITQSPNGEKPSPDWPSDGLNGQRFEYGMDSYIVSHGTWGPLLDDALISIPTMSIVTDLDNLFNPSRSSATGGIYVNAGQHGRAWERPTSLELIYPPNPQGPGFPDLVQVPDGHGGVRWELPRKMQGGFQTNAGLRIRGGFSRSGGNPKHAFRIFFRSEYRDGELNYPLFGSEGAESFDKVDVRTSQNYSWSFQNDGANTMCREVWARDTQGLTGHPYTRSRYYHLYINGHYWGIFQTQERSEASYGESYFGGSQDEYDTVKATGPNAGYTIEATDGNLDAWRELWDLANLGFGSDAIYYRAQGLNPDGTRNLGYPVLLDVDNLIDYMLQVFYDGDRDAPISNFLSNTRTNNWFSVRSRTGDEGFRYFVHDAEHIMSRGLTNRTGPYPCGDQFQYSNPQWIHQELMAHPDYRMRFADHAQKHLFNSGLLTASKAIERFRGRADQIDMAIIAESARWGNSSLNKSTWQGALGNEIDWFFPNRSETIVSQLKNTRLMSGASAPLYPSISAPSFNHLGGPVPKDYPLTMSGVGTVYYTLDGADPRLPGGAVNTAHAKTYSTAINLTASTHVKARAKSGSTWSALTEAVFAIGPVAQSLRITEIMYHPQFAGDPNDPNEEFIELKNIGSEKINLNLVKFTNGIDFTFGDLELGAGEHVVVVKNRAVFDAQYPGFSGVIAGEYAGRLDNAGERIRLQDAIGQTILDFKYKDGWRSITDGGGYSLTIIDPTDSTSDRPDEGLVAHWALDDGPGTLAIDSAGSNNGTVHGDPTWTTGRIGEALSFDGSGDYISLSSISALTGNNLTAAAWIRVTGLTGIWNPILTQHNPSNDGYYLYVFDDKPAFSVLAGGSTAIAGSPEVINWGQWYHVAGTNDGSNLRIYIDGHLKGSGPSSGLTGVDYAACLGYDYASAAYYTGQIDDVRIYNRPLSEYEFEGIISSLEHWNEKDSWRASAYSGGSPGSDDSGIIPNPGAIVINELLAHSPGTPESWIELYNTTDAQIDIGRWYLSDSEIDLKKYRFADGTKIDAGEYVVFSEDTHFGELSTDPGRITAFAFSSTGGKAYLTSAEAGVLTGYRAVEDFGASETDVPFGRYFKRSTGNYNFVAMSAATPWLPNAYPKVGPIVINEIMYNPQSGDQKQEYIELHNIGPVDVTLYDPEEGLPWKFTDGIEYTFPYPGATIPAGGYLLMVKDMTAHLAQYGLPPSEVRVLGPYDGKLSNGGEKLELSKPGGLDLFGRRHYIRLDRVNYSDGSHPEDCPGGADLWPIEADGSGKSLIRTTPANYGNDPNNWTAATPSPGL